METAKKRLAILNLAGELGPELARYLSARKISVLAPVAGAGGGWTHVLTKDREDFAALNEAHGLVAGDRHVISLTRVADLRAFTANNGNLILDDAWFRTPLGPFIMDKYFQSFGGIALGDNYPAFTEAGSFNVANPFNTGEYVDRMVSRAFEHGTEALAVKTYFDHLLMYVAGLKNKGKAGLPFEVTYGSFEDVFALQVHFFAGALALPDVTASLGPALSKRPEEYYLNVAVQAADFFDLSFLPEVSKVVVTGLWTKDERIRFENRGLMVTALAGGVPLAQYKNDGVPAAIVIGASPIEDFSARVSISGAAPEAPAATHVRGTKEDLAEAATLVKGAPIVEDETETRISGGGDEGDADAVTRPAASPVERETAWRVSGGVPEEGGESTTVSGGPAEKLAATVVAGKREAEKKVVTVLAGDGPEAAPEALRIQKSDGPDKGRGVLTVKSLGVGPIDAKTGLFDFARGLGKVPEELSETEVRQFLDRDVSGPGPLDHPVVRQLEAELVSAGAENERLRRQLKTLAAEVRIFKDNRDKLREIQTKAAAETEQLEAKVLAEDPVRRQLQQKLQEQKALSELELKKVTSYFEKESKLVEDQRQLELKIRKLELEATQKETFFAQELERVDRLAKGKEIILAKMKETLTKLVERKEREIANLKFKTDELARALASGPAAAQTQQLRDLEKQNLTLQRQLEVQKKQLANMSSNLQPSKGEEEFKEEARKLQMMNQQLKNQIDLGGREAEKLKARISLDGSQMTQLRVEKARLEQDLKKALQETKTALTIAPSTGALEQELKKSQTHAQILETRLKDAQVKLAALETKVVELQKPQKVVATDEAAKGKLGHLEGQVKKLTQDITARDNLLSEAKKEANKLRAEKTALQNQIDKLKKDAEKNDKNKLGAPKKPGGKAA